MSQNSKPPQAEAAEASAPLASPEDEGRNPVWRIWAGVAVLMLVAFWFAWQFVGDPPPKQIRIATGSANGGYDRGGQALRDALARDGIEVLLRQSAGSLENLELLQAGEVDVAFVQGGTVATPRGELEPGQEPGASGLFAIASLYFEPLWIFVRKDSQIAKLSDLRGRRVEIGAPGSGTRSLVLELLRANGAAANPALLGELSFDAAIAELRAGAATRPVS
jgi:TRAP transporter TAXI family solute receptor